ncbi:MAG: radical SAM protein [Candidatus Thermoplasmatota archaeon]|nr:radical SAM protein [Candidatus Thermoplasmatota archaeon]
MKEIQAKTLIRKFKRIDSWFIARYAMNLYRGCLHNCVYCDGRTEKYQVSGEFGSDIGVKINAIELLEKELNPYRRRQPLTPGFVMLGGGVGDSYQPIEDSYHLAQKTLKLLFKYKWPVHILTKSTRVIKDIDIIKKINEQKKAILSFSFSSTDDAISKKFEPGVPPPSERLETITQLTNHGIPCGMFLMPPIPFITDTSRYLEQSIADAKKAGALFVIFGGMTLKEGKQKQYFMETLKQQYPHLMTEYHHIYKPNPWGQAIPQYYQAVHHSIYVLAKKYKMPLRIPHQLFSDASDGKRGSDKRFNKRSRVLGRV